MQEPRRTCGKHAVGTLSAAVLPHAHSLFASLAFTTALVVGCLTHYEDLVKNSYYGYPDEWFPSLSATIGDKYPARSLFQIFIALASFPHFAMMFVNFAWQRCQTPSSVLPGVVLVFGLVRTLALAAWVYITSTDHHFVHEVAMVLYLVASIPYFAGSVTAIATAPEKSIMAQRWRKRLLILFVANIVPVVWFFVQHKVYRVAGAYSLFALFEWSFIIYDVAFDGLSAAELSRLQIRIVDLGNANGRAQPLWHLPAVQGYVHADASPGSSEHEDSDHSRLYSAASCHHHSDGGPEKASIWIERVHFLSTANAAFTFWSLITGLPAAVWYFPLWNMGLSGYEAFLFSNVAPALLLGRRIPSAPFQVLASLGILAHHWQDPVTRLTVSALGTMAASIAWFRLFRADNRRLEHDIAAWLCGLLLHMYFKAAFRGNNPMWPIMHKEVTGWNTLGCSHISLMSSVFLVFIGDRFKSVSPNKVAGHGSAFAAGIGLGALCFTLHCFFTDSTTVLRWGVSGHPGIWLDPVPWGVITMLCATAGIVLSIQRMALSLAWHALGSLAAFGVYFLPGVYSSCCGWLLVVYTFSIAPALLRAVSVAPACRTLLVGLLFWNFLVLANVWTVAYEFVPLGEYLRERSGLIIACTVAGMLLGAWNARNTSRYAGATLFSESPAVRRRFRRKVLYPILVCYAIFSILLYGRRFYCLIRMQRHSRPSPLEKEHVFTAGIWTIHFGLDNNMWTSEQRIRDVINDLGVDVIGLLESDVQHIITGNRDLTQSLGEELGYYSDYGPSPAKHTWGCTLLSRFPIINSTHHLLPSPVGELACAIHATLRVYGREVDVLVSHNGQEENAEDRFQQTTEIARILRDTAHRPTVFLGYLVTKPHDWIYNILMDDGGGMVDVDSEHHDRWCQYIAFRGLQRIGYAQLSHGTITDTELQVARFQLTRNRTTVFGPGLAVNASMVARVLRFPAKYDDPNGSGGHVYQGWPGGPRYFAY